MNENSIQYGQTDFNLPHDIVTLPSGGRYYKSKKKAVKVGYLTATDENLINSLISNNDIENLIIRLIRQKLYEPDLRPEELLYGDIQAILIFLRNTAFGPEFVKDVIDPQTNKVFQTTISLEELNFKKPSVEPDENGLYTILLPKSNVTVKLKPLTIGDDIEITKRLESYPVGMTQPKVTLKLEKHIQEVNGNTDRGYIVEFANKLPIADSKFIRNFMIENEPAIDLKRIVRAPSGEMVTTEITMGLEFFRPFF
jgi:hypothetical protein